MATKTIVVEPVALKNAITVGNHEYFAAFDGRYFTFLPKGEKVFVPATGYTANGLVEAQMALAAFRAAAAGVIGGNPNFILTAPLEKLDRAIPSGVLGWVYNEYDQLKDAVTHEGLVLQVPPSLIPTSVYGPAWKQARVYKGTVYAGAWQNIFTVHGEMDHNGQLVYKPDKVKKVRDSSGQLVPALTVNTSAFWYMEAHRALLEGRAVSASCGGWLLEKVQETLDVLQADNPAEAHDTLRWQGREEGRAREARTEAENIITAEGVDASKLSLEVPMFGGGVYDLARLPIGPVILATKSGTRISQYLRDGSPVSRAALAETIRNCGYQLIVS